MSVRKLLYATDLKDQERTLSFLNRLLPLQQVGLEEIISLQARQFKDMQKELSDSGIRYTFLAEEELLPEGILSLAKKEEVSIIAVNLERHARKPSYTSFIKNLLKGSLVPIMFVNNTEQIPEPAKKGLFEHVIFATDWSPASEKALAYLLGFKEIMGELDIVNVINEKLTVRDMRELKEKLAETRKICLDEKIDAESHIYAGKTSEEIITAGRDYKATIIVAGTSPKKSTIKDIFRSSPSFRVAKEATVPVLLIP